MLLRIRASKSSLNLILVILTCVSMQEARTAIDSLVPAVEGIRTSSQDVSRRLAALEQSAHHLSDMNQYQGNEQHSEIATNAGSSRAQNHTGQENLSGSQGPAIPTSTSNTQPILNDLEILLQCSRPYARLETGFQKLTRSSASNYTALDSIATGISLSAVSNLSLVSLPISFHEIWNKSHYVIDAVPRNPSLSDEEQPSTAFESSGPSSSSALSQDNENASASMETLVDRQGMVKPARKIVLHGTDESGISTLVKEMQIAYALDTITATEMENVRHELFSNLVIAFQMTLEEISEREWRYGTDQSTAERLIHLMEILWRDPTFQKALRLGHEFVQFDNIYYCFRHRSQLFLRRRAISIDDFLRVRIRTTNVTEKYFETAKYVYHVVDVEGIRSGRKQWIYTWKGADCLFFVASLAGYNRCLIEASDTNQLQESLLLFESLLSTSYLKNVTIVLVLNKLDVFRQQIQEHPLRLWFPDFVGREKDHEAALTYIEAKFKALKRLSDEREIHVYYTDATNIENCQATLRDIEERFMPSVCSQNWEEMGTPIFGRAPTNPSIPRTRP
ncbi:MAG: hypothetical protein Q9221_006731 [Calogaya cf. arnoldii]